MALTIKKAVGGHQTAFKKHLNDSKHITDKIYQQRFDRNRLPKPLIYYQAAFKHYKVRGQWIQTLCCFHDDHHPSLFLNLATGAFKCFACGIRGGDIIHFHQYFHRIDFKTAAKMLGAWRQ